MNFTIIIHIGAKTLRGLAVRMVFNVSWGIVVVGNVLRNAFFIGDSIVCITFYCQHGERSITKQI